MKRVYMVKAYNKYDDDTEIVGIAEDQAKAEAMVEDYINNIYCYGTARFMITSWNLNERWGEVRTEKYFTYEEVIRIAERLGKYKAADEAKDNCEVGACGAKCNNCLEATKIKWETTNDGK